MARGFPASAALIGFCFAGSLLGAGAIQAQRRTPGESAESASRRVTLGGWVRGEYSHSLPGGVSVRLETGEGMLAGEQPVNAGGYFEFLGLAPSFYHLTIRASGFQTYQQDLDLRSVGTRLNLNIQLAPIHQSPSREHSSAPSLTDAQAPRNARKEYERGARALRKGKSSDAEVHLQKAVEEYSCYARAQTDLAIALADEHDLRRSEAALRQAIACDPDYVAAYEVLGRLYFDTQRYQDSVDALQQGVRRSPASWQLYYQLGSCQYALRQYPNAEQSYLRAQSLSADVPAEIHVKLADVYLKQTAYLKAYAEMQAYLRAEPDGPFASELRSVSRRMESDGTVPPNWQKAQSSPAGPR